MLIFLKSLYLSRVDEKVDFGSLRLNVSASKKLCSRREQETATLAPRVLEVFSRGFPARVFQQSQN